MHPPFRLIIFLLSLSGFTISVLLAYLLFIPQPAFRCGVNMPPVYCGTSALEASPSIITDTIARTRFEKGRSIFHAAGCKSCHAPCRKIVGPALYKISDRRKKKWIIRAVRDFNDLLEKKDKTAWMLMEEYKNVGIMPDHRFLDRDEDIEAIIFYLDHSLCPD